MGVLLCAEKDGLWLYLGKCVLCGAFATFWVRRQNLWLEVFVALELIGPHGLRSRTPSGAV